MSPSKYKKVIHMAVNPKNKKTYRTIQQAGGEVCDISGLTEQTAIITNAD